MPDRIWSREWPRAKKLRRMPALLILACRSTTSASTPARLINASHPPNPANSKSPAGRAPAPVESSPAVIGSEPPSRSETIPPASNEPTTMKYSLNELLLELADAYFDLDQHDLREDARAALHANASLVKTIVADRKSVV